MDGKEMIYTELCLQSDFIFLFLESVAKCGLEFSHTQTVLHQTPREQRYHQSGNIPLLFSQKPSPTQNLYVYPVLTAALIFRNHPQGAPGGNLVKSLSLKSLRKLNGFPKMAHYVSDRY